MTNIKIKDIEIYHPQHEVDNDFYLSHFQKKGIDATKFLEKVLGRNKRYVINDEGENSLTMAIEASKRVLEKASLSGKELDLIIFSSQTPEYLATTNAIQLHRVLEASHHTITFDQNANCAGMMVAIDHASRYMLQNPHVKTALVVGSDFNTLMSNPEQEISYGNFGDASCAVLLEKTEEDAGLIDSIYYTDSSTFDKTYFPRKGLSKLIRGQKEEQSIDWIPFDGDVALPPTYQMIETILKRNELTLSDAKGYCLSQFSIANIQRIQEHFNLEDDQILYIGDQFGYTGTSSPFLAFYKGIESGRIKRGDTVLFWTIGGGYQLVAMLFKY